MDRQMSSPLFASKCDVQNMKENTKRFYSLTNRFVSPERIKCPGKW